MMVPMRLILNILRHYTVSAWFHNLSAAKPAKHCITSFCIPVSTLCRRQSLGKSTTSFAVLERCFTRSYLIKHHTVQAPILQARPTMVLSWAGDTQSDPRKLAVEKQANIRGMKLPPKLEQRLTKLKLYYQFLLQETASTDTLRLISGPIPLVKLCSIARDLRQLQVLRRWMGSL